LLIRLCLGRQALAEDSCRLGSEALGAFSIEAQVRKKVRYFGTPKGNPQTARWQLVLGGYRFTVASSTSLPLMVLKGLPLTVD